MIIEIPITQITWSRVKAKSRLKAQPNGEITTISRKTSHSPRLSRNAAVSLQFQPPLANARYAPEPVRKTKTGAQKWVIQRVKNQRALVLVRSVGSKVAPEK